MLITIAMAIASYLGERCKSKQKQPRNRKNLRESAGISMEDVETTI